MATNVVRHVYMLRYINLDPKPFEMPRLTITVSIMSAAHHQYILQLVGQLQPM